MWNAKEEWTDVGVILYCSDGSPASCPEANEFEILYLVQTTEEDDPAGGVDPIGEDR
jgi:hypothetical protein